MGATHKFLPVWRELSKYTKPPQATTLFKRCNCQAFNV
jgi:hypothetical protein